MLTDLGLTPVCAACGVGGLWTPSGDRTAVLDNFKRRCEQFKALGLPRVYVPAGAIQKFTQDDYKGVAAAMHEAGDIAKQFELTVLVEAVRASNYISTLPHCQGDARGPKRRACSVLYFWSG